MAQDHFYSSTAQPTTLSSGITAGSATIIVGATTGFPVNFPYTLAIDYGTSIEELVDVTAAAGTTLTVTRAVDSTSAASHNPGAAVRHVSCARDFTEFNTHVNATAGVHGVTGSIVGTTDAQVLTNKTYQSGVFSGTWSGNFVGSSSFTSTSTGTNFSAINSAGNATFASKDSTQANAAWFTETGGKHWWGPGTAAVDTNLYRSGVNALTTDGSLTVGGGLTTNGNLSAGGVGKVLTFTKTSDKSITSNTTLAIDTDFVFVLDVGTWDIDGFLWYNGAAIGTGDLKLQLGTAGGGSISVAGSFWAFHAPTLSSANALEAAATAFNASKSYGSAGASNPIGGILKGTIVVVSTPITFQLLWAQNTSSVTPTIMKTGSRVTLTRRL